MAIIKISELPAADSPVSPSDVAPFLQNGVTKKAAINQLGFIADGVNAVTRTIQGKLRERISVVDFGVLPGAANAIANCNAYANLAAYVNSIGGNCEIVWPAAEDPYEFTAYLNPTYNATPNLWRGVVELVNVKNCYHVGYGATAKFNMNPTWYRGNPNVASLDESVFQFRGETAQGNCDHVGVRGLRIESTATIKSPAAPGLSDGGSMGILYRGCTNTLTENVTCYQWGTDGLYFGTAYANAFGGYGHTVINPVMIANYRQGISIVQNNNGTIIGGVIQDTDGSSFGHGIDWEPDGAGLQHDWTVVGIKTKNNQRGAVNFINTSNVTLIGCEFDEQRDGNVAGAVYLDTGIGGVENIVFDNCNITAINSAIYYSGGSNVTGKIDNIRFCNGTKISSVGTVINSGAFFRVNPFGSSNGEIGDFYFDDVVVDGNGGFYMNNGASGTAKMFFRNSKWNLRNPAGGALSLTIETGATQFHFENMEMTVDAASTISGTYVPFVQGGKLVDCTLSSHSGAVIAWANYGTNRQNFYIGLNDFSTHNYFKWTSSASSALDLTVKGTPEQFYSGDFGAPGRIVHGGLARVSLWQSNPAYFTGRQAPASGDITIDGGLNAPDTAPIIFIYFAGSVNNWQVAAGTMQIGNTSNRPSATLGQAQRGQAYFDTTLAADGKPIWFNGTSWVDATGAVV